MLKTTRGLVFVAAALVGLSSPVAAGDGPWYVGASIGPSDLDTTYGQRWPKRFDDSSDAKGVSVGYQINRYLAVEAGYQDLGEFTGVGALCSETEEFCIASLIQLGLCVEGTQCDPLLVAAGLVAEVEAWSASVVPQYPLTDRFIAFGRLGLRSSEAQVRDDGTFGGRRIESFSDEEFWAGAGLRYAFPSGLGLSVELQELDDARASVAGVSWRF